MLSVEDFCRILKRNGFGPYAGVPCSILKPLINYLLDSYDMTYYTATSEGEAMGIAGGFGLAGKIPVVLMQNSGLGNAITPLTSLQLVYNLPALILVSWRGEPGKPDEPEHRVMGPITRELLDVIGIPNECLVESNHELKNQILRMKGIVTKTNRPVALIVKKGAFTEYIQKAGEKELKVPLMQRKEARIALDKAVFSRFQNGVPKELQLVIRVDRGSQFIAKVFKDAVKLSGLTIQFCGIQCPNDKPYIESFISKYKTEEIYRNCYETFNDEKKAWKNYKFLV